LDQTRALSTLSAPQEFDGIDNQHQNEKDRESDRDAGKELTSKISKQSMGQAH
jgi:hypothetical protein